MVSVSAKADVTVPTPVAVLFKNLTVAPSLCVAAVESSTPLAAAPLNVI